MLKPSFIAAPVWLFAVTAVVAQPTARQWVEMGKQCQLNTEYINDTGDDLEVSVSIWSGVTPRSDGILHCVVSLTIEGVSKIGYQFMNNVPNPQGGNPAVMCNATAIVPANDWYKVDTDTFTDVYLNNWEELRSTTGPQVCDPYPSSTSSSSKRARRPNG